MIDETENAKGLNIMKTLIYCDWCHNQNKLMRK